MANNIRKYLEYCFFMLVNILLISPMIKVYNFLSGIICLKFLSFFLNINIAIPNNIYNFKNVFYISESEPIIFIATTCFCFSLLLIKPFIFQIIYITNRFPYIKNFFNKILLERKYLYNVLIFAFLIDFTCIFLFKDFLAPFLGLALNYISFLLFFKPALKDKNKLVNESTILFTKRFLLIISILIAIINFIGFLLFLVISITYI